MRNLRRSARRHQAATSPDIYTEFPVGTRVWTPHALWGVVTDVEHGGTPGDEKYLVVLDDEMGGGVYDSIELQVPCSDCGDLFNPDWEDEAGSLHNHRNEAIDKFHADAISATGSLTKTADEDQCPYCAGDSLMEGGIYRCEEGHLWDPHGDAAQMYAETHDLQPLPDNVSLTWPQDAWAAARTAEVRWDTPGPSEIIMALVEDFRGYCPVCRAQLWEGQAHEHQVAPRAAQTQKELAFVATLHSRTAAIPLKCDGCGEVYFTDGEGHGCEGSLHDHWTAEASVEASTPHVASEDYPELSEILVDRPPLAHSERIAARRTELGMPQVRTAGSIPPIPDWAILQQFGQYPQSGSGLTYFKGEIDAETWVDCLLYYKDGALVGVLNHFPQDMGPERKGNVLLMVHPAHRRQGVGSALWNEAKRRWGVTAQGQDQTPDGSAFTNRVGHLQSLGGFFDKMLAPIADNMLERQQESGYGSYNPETGEMPSVDWCRFRKNRRCFFPKTLDKDATEQAGYAVWVPEDRGFCPRDKWADQKACPAPSEPGPKSGERNWRYETWKSWQEGGQQKGASLESEALNVARDVKELTDRAPEPQAAPPSDLVGELAEVVQEHRQRKNNPYSDSNPYTSALREGEFGFHLTAAWKDVQAKAKRIRGDGKVRIISASVEYLVGEIQGDKNIYQATLMREPGTKRVALWECGCAWAAYSWGRSGRWKKYEGRLCSHALALNYEAQSRGWAGGSITEDTRTPDWRADQKVVVPGDYAKSPAGKWRVGSVEEEWTPRTASTDPSLAAAPVLAMVRDMLGDGDTPAQVSATLAALGVDDLDGLVSEAMAAPAFRGLVGGSPVDIIDLNDDDTVEVRGRGKVPAREVYYPSYHPTRGLNMMGGKYAYHHASDGSHDLGVGGAPGGGVREAGRLPGQPSNPFDAEADGPRLRARQASEADAGVSGDVGGGAWADSLWVGPAPSVRDASVHRGGVPRTDDEGGPRRPARADEGGADSLQARARVDSGEHPHRPQDGMALLPSLSPGRPGGVAKGAEDPTRGLMASLQTTAAPVLGQFEDLTDVATYMATQAEQAEPRVTPVLQGIARENHGEMIGLEYRLKKMPSLLRKLNDKVQGDPAQIRDPFSVINDTLRYTMAYPEPGWGDQVQDTLYELQGRGFKILNEKNTWMRGDPYSGLHYEFGVPGSQVRFELQFHTSKSFHLKDKVLHEMYEEFREARTPLPRKQHLYDEMTKFWDDLPIPDNALDFAGETFLPRPVASSRQAAVMAHLDEILRAAVAAEDADAIVIEPRDHLWGWRCTKCGETEVGTGRSGKGYADKAQAQEYGENHAMVCWDLDWGQPVNVREARLQVRAAADTDGLMVAFTPPPHVAEAIHRDIDALWGADAEHPTQYHVTLVYPGDADEIDADAFEAAARDWASRQGPFTAKISGYGVFHQDGGDKVLYASIDAPGFGGPRQDLVDTMRRFGIDPPENHGWTAHCTLAYLSQSQWNQVTSSYDGPTDAGRGGQSDALRGRAGGGLPGLSPQSFQEASADQGRRAGNHRVQGGLGGGAWSDSGGDGRASSVPRPSMREAGAPAPAPLLGSFGASRRGEATDRVQGSWDPVLAQELSRLGSVPGVPEGGVGSLSKESKGSLLDLELPEEALGEWTVSDVAIVIGQDWKRASLDQSRIDIGGGRDNAWGYLPWGQYEGDVVWAGPNHDAGEMAPLQGSPEAAASFVAEGDLHDPQEPALPSTTAEDDEEMVSDFVGDETDLAKAGSVEEIVAKFQATAGAAAIQANSTPARSQGGDDLNIAAAAKAHLAKTALKDFTPAEQKQIIEEGSVEGVVAGNLDRLNISGTHYEALEAALKEAEAEAEDDSWLL